MAGGEFAERAPVLFVFLCLIFSNYSIVNVNSLSCICEPCEKYLNGTCQTEPGGWCFTLVHKEEDGETYWTLGCIPPEESVTPFMCMANSVPSRYARMIECCNDKDFCNEHLDPPIHLAKTLPPPDSQSEVSSLTHMQMFFLVTMVVLVFSFSMVSVYICHRLRKRERCAKFLKGKEDCLTFETESHVVNEVAGVSSGSGSGLPLLVQTTICKQIQFEHIIGKGRFGEVWKANYLDENVAVKIFLTTEEASWSREVQLYKTALLSHENILSFIGADIKGTGSWTQLLLVMGYHENGSLHDYLNRHDLDLPTLLKMAVSIASGLTHLHVEIRGIPGKPSIAHRDLKSKNILVKKDLACCIGDLGLAVRFLSEARELDANINTRQGTRRYMAPEVLSEMLNKNNFESLKRADMYAIALVFWEMARRCNVCGPAEEYQAPYYDVVGGDPSFEDMKKVVCLDGIRPLIDPRWIQIPALKSFIQMMAECWHHNPDVRLSALRVKKSLAKLRDSLVEEELPFVRVQ